MGLIRAKGILHRMIGRVTATNRPAWQEHWTARTAAIAAHLHWAGPQSLLLVGDSLIELVPAHPLEGLNVINAGFGGATAEYVLASVTSSVVSRALKANPPRMAIIQAGTNDSRKGVEAKAVSEKIIAISSFFRGIGTEPIIFAIPPIEEKKTAYRSAEVAAAINEATRLASLGHAPFIDPYAMVRGSDDLTEDGIHLSRKSVVALVEAIRAAALPPDLKAA